MICYTRRTVAALFFIWGLVSAVYALLSFSGLGGLGLIAAGIAVAAYLFPENIEWTRPNFLSRWAAGAFTVVLCRLLR